MVENAGLPGKSFLISFKDRSPEIVFLFNIEVIFVIKIWKGAHEDAKSKMALRKGKKGQLELARSQIAHNHQL